jgi:hypothetical protein
MFTPPSLVAFSVLPVPTLVTCHAATEYFLYFTLAQGKGVLLVMLIALQLDSYYVQGFSPFLVYKPQNASYGYS